MIKKCSKCGIEKPINEFSKSKTGKYGVRADCKGCQKIYYSQNKERQLATKREWRKKNRDKERGYNKKHYEANKEQMDAKSKIRSKIYYYENKEEVSLKSKKRYEKNKEKKIEYQKEYYEENREEILVKNKEKYHANKKEINEQKKRYNKRKRATDPIYKLKSNVSHSIRRELKSNGSSKNGKSCLDYLPYTIEQLKEHLQSQFEEWMTWENHGKYIVKTWDDNDKSTWTWQIDHVEPHSNFHYTSMEDQGFRDCWALSNLRPLSAKQNVLDGNTRARHKKKSRA